MTQDTTEWRQIVDRRLNALELRNAAEEVHRQNVSVRLGAIEDTLKWLVRLIVGGLLMALIAYIVQGGLVP